MIHITRPEAPSFLTEPNSIWENETKEAKAHYETAQTKAFKFEAYRDKRLKDELEKVFVKCAYCESNYQASSDGDIEHFRPKGKIKEINRSPGYYWLANDWDNLFLSCQHCNQSRRQNVFDSTTKKSIGKKDQFPLKKELNRMENPTDSLSKEEKDRLLLNPCIDKPLEHFEYDDLQPIMIAKTEMAEVSIEVYAFERIKLIKERKKVKIHLFQQMELTKSALQSWNNHPDDDNLKNTYTLAFDLMMTFTEADKPYAGMCRYYVKKFLTENELVV